jgi:hypothetical protein
MIKRIHVNQHLIRRNAKFNEDAPPLTVKTSRGNYRAHAVDIDGPAKVVYRPSSPLSCGARVWIETLAPVIIARNGQSEVDTLD